MEEFESNLKQIEDLSKSAVSTLFLILVSSGYILLTIVGMRDGDLVATTAKATASILPVINISLNSRVFSVLSLYLLLISYTYFLVTVHSLTRILLRTPLYSCSSFSLYSSVHPWFFNFWAHDLLLSSSAVSRASRQNRLGEMFLKTGFVGLLFWGAVPLTMFIVIVRVSIVRDLSLILPMYIAFVIISILVCCSLTVFSGDQNAYSGSRSLWERVLAVVICLLLVSSVGLIAYLGHTERFRRLDFKGYDFTNADLRGCDLRNSDLTLAVLDSADLTEANLSGAVFRSSSLKNANLAGQVLEGLDFTSAILDKADMTGVFLRSHGKKKVVMENASLIGVNFEGSMLSGVDFTRSNLESALLCDVQLMAECDFSNTSFKNATLRSCCIARSEGDKCEFFSTSFAGAWIGAGASYKDKMNLSGYDLSGCDFSGATISGVDMIGADGYRSDFDSCTFSNVDISNANLSQCIIDDSNFTAVIAKNTQFSGSSMRRVIIESSSDFSGVFINDVDMTGASIHHVRMSQIHANASIFREADMKGVNLAKSSLKFSDLTSADLRDAVILSDSSLLGATLDGVKIDDNSTLGGMKIYPKEWESLLMRDPAGEADLPIKARWKTQKEPGGWLVVKEKLSDD